MTVLKPEEVARRNEKTADRRHDIRIALCSGGVGLAGALIGVIGGLLGGVWIADKQIEASAEQAQNSFQRDERKESYSDFLKVDILAKTLEEDIQVATEDGVTRTEFKMLSRRAKNMMERLTSAQSDILLFGSIDIAVASEQLRGTHFLYLTDLIAIASFDAENVRGPRVQEVIDRVYQEGEDAVEASSDYLLAIRADLDIEG